MTWLRRLVLACSGARPVRRCRCRPTTRPGPASCRSRAQTRSRPRSGAGPQTSADRSSERTYVATAASQPDDGDDDTVAPQLLHR